MTLMVRDEVDLVAAMIEHHLAQGVDLIIATDNGSVDGTREVLADYAALGAVELHDDPHHRKQQAAYGNDPWMRQSVDGVFEHLGKGQRVDDVRDVRRGRQAKPASAGQIVPESACGPIYKPREGSGQKKTSAGRGPKQRQTPSMMNGSLAHAAILPVNRHKSKFAIYCRGCSTTSSPTGRVTNHGVDADAILRACSASSSWPICSRASPRSTQASIWAGSRLMDSLHRRMVSSIRLLASDRAASNAQAA